MSIEDIVVPEIVTLEKGEVNVYEDYLATEVMAT